MLEPAIEDDGRRLASLAAAGAVAEHPALAETGRRGKLGVEVHVAVDGSALVVDG